MKHPQTVWFNGEEVCGSCYQRLGQLHGSRCYPGYVYTNLNPITDWHEDTRESEVAGIAPPVAGHDSVEQIGSMPNKIPPVPNNIPLPVAEFAQILRECGLDITGTVLAKNLAYGDSVNNTDKIVGILYPNGIRPEQIRSFLLIIRMLDKINRLACGDPEAYGEDPWADLGGYAAIGMAQERRDKR